MYIYNEINLVSSYNDGFEVDVTIGTTILDDIVISYNAEHYGDLGEDYFRHKENIHAVIDSYEIKVMAKHLGITPDKVKQHLIDKFDDNDSYISYIPYIRNYFHDILDYILDCGAKYRIKD